MHNVAIVGAGYAGLASAFHLLPFSSQITIFDAGETSASSISTGLLHLFNGEHARKSWKGDEALKEAIHLFEAASHHLGKPVFEKKPVFRPAVIPKQEISFRKTAEEHAEAIWWEKERVGEFLPDFTPLPGLYLSEGFVVDSALYLQGLLGYLEKRGVEYVKRKILSLEELSSFDRVILALGAQSLDFPLLSSLPLSVTKGQMLLCKPKRARSLPFSICGKGHITSLSNGLVLLGSTYERDYRDGSPNRERASLLQTEMGEYFPWVKELEIVEVKSAFRIAKRGSYLPVIQKISEKVCLFTGLGSRGLLYGSYFAREFAEKL